MERADSSARNLTAIPSIRFSRPTIRRHSAAGCRGDRSGDTRRGATDAAIEPHDHIANAQTAIGGSLRTVGDVSVCRVGVGGGGG